MCTVIVTQGSKEALTAINYSRGYVARGAFWHNSNGIGFDKEHFKQEKISPPEDMDWMVVHCRQPTQGSPNNPNNNHPWSIDGQHRFIVGCQVGFCRYKDAPKYELQGDCDSELAMKVLAEEKDPWDWIKENVTGMLFFWAGTNDKQGALYAYNPVLTQVTDKGKDLSMWITRGIHGREQGLYEVQFTQDGMVMVPVQNTIVKG